MIEKLQGETEIPESIDIGLVGEVTKVNQQIIDVVTNSGFIPVVAPIGAGKDNETYNINADLVAGKIAEKLRAEKLILLTNVSGIRNAKDKLISRLLPQEAEILIEEVRSRKG